MNTSATPLVSICVPVYNGAAYLAETLESLLAQTYEHIEIIVSDNASSDNTFAIIQQFMDRDARVRSIRHDQTVVYAENCNSIVKLAQGKYVALYHADDIYESNIVQEQVAYLNQHEQVAGVFTLGQVIDAQGNYLSADKYFTQLPQAAGENPVITLDLYVKTLCEQGNIFICPSSMIRRAVYQQVGLYDPQISMVEDLDMYCRILSQHPLAIISKRCIRYRIHQKQGSQVYRSYLRNTVAKDIEFLTQLVNGDKRYSALRTVMQARLAFDYLKLAIYAACRGEYGNYCHMIHQAKQTQLFPWSQLAKRLLQVLPKPLGYLGIYVTLGLYMRCRKR